MGEELLEIISMLVKEKEERDLAIKTITIAGYREYYTVTIEFDKEETRENMTEISAELASMLISLRERETPNCIVMIETIHEGLGDQEWLTKSIRIKVPNKKPTN